MKKTIRTVLLCAVCLVMTVAMVIPAGAVGHDFGKKTNSVLYEKSALFVGDSISYGSTDDSTYYKKGAWAGRIGTVNSMDYVNASVSGASCSTIRGENRIYKQLLEHEGTHFDYVILHGGVNDAWSLAPIGKMTASDCFDVDKFDTTTFAGGLEELFYYATDLYPDARIGYIINFQAPMCQKGTVKDMEAYFAEARKICKKWNMPYLDLYADEDFCFDELKVNTTECLPDYIHPNGVGYDILYPVIEGWMETLREYGEPEETDPIVTQPVAQSTTQITTEVTTTAPATDAPAPEKSGCQSALNSEAFVVVAISAVAVGVTVRKKEKRKFFN